MQRRAVEVRRSRSTTTLPSSRRLELAVAALAPSYWFRADNVTLSGSSVTAIKNKVAIDTLTVTGTLVQGGLGRSVGISFTGTQFVQSNLSAAVWKFRHDGTGYEEFFVYQPADNTGLQTYVATRNYGAAAGNAMYNNAGATAVAIANGTTDILGSSAGVVPLGTVTYVNTSYNTTDTPDATFRVKTSAFFSGNQTGTPSSGNPLNHLVIGADANGLNPGRFTFGEYIGFRRSLTVAERLVFQRYYEARY